MSYEIHEHNAITDTYTSRLATEEEVAILEAEKAAKADEEFTKAAAKAAADAKLTAFYESVGLTPDEIAAKL